MVIGQDILRRYTDVLLFDLPDERIKDKARAKKNQELLRK